ncbi:hypothetical protein [Cognatishimia sp.]|uniref:hypothetical protein n=1 Tax=Cognatishimia sp. TaxID=2211648 RepID=UPI003514E2D5|nr:hypothetical protein [Cognatishimia sp.]
MDNQLKQCTKKKKGARKPPSIRTLPVGLADLFMSWTLRFISLQVNRLSGKSERSLFIILNMA